MKVTFRPHQIEMGEEQLKKLREYGFVYNSSEERTGKTFTVLYTTEKSLAKKILIITKKKAIPDWQTSIEMLESDKHYEVINFESSHKRKLLDPDLIVIDECHHALASYPKPSKTFKTLKPICKNKPLIFISATPYAESYSQIFHQLHLSSWSPFIKYRNFYDWHKVYGIKEVEYIAGRSIVKYHKTKEDLIKKEIDKYFVKTTRKEVGFKHEAEDIKHYVNLDDDTLKLINTVKKDRVFDMPEGQVLVENVGSMLQKMYQVEGGTIRYEVNDIEFISILPNTEKIDYIKDKWGDTEDLVIMYHYRNEEIKLKQHFKHALILQGTTYAEGISLKHKKHLVIYSMDWRTSKYIQRRNRQADKERDEEIHVHYLLCKGQVSEKIYEAVVEKRTNFNGRYYLESENDRSTNTN